jgi:DNA-binding FadR family transcriptional regulator
MFSPYRSKRAFEDVEEQIRQAILSGRLREGERLPSERALAEQFEAGRLTIREALRTLETKGFLKIKKGSVGGAYVEVGNRQNLAGIIIDNLTLGGLTGRQLTEARVALESGIVKAVIKRANRSDMSRIGEDLDESGNMSTQDDPRAVISKMISFHLLLGDASHNPTFIIFIRALMEWAKRKLVSYIPSHNHIQYSYEAHMGIFNAVKKKDVALAQRLMKTHVEKMSVFVSRPGINKRQAQKRAMRGPSEPDLFYLGRFGD